MSKSGTKYITISKEFTLEKLMATIPAHSLFERIRRNNAAETLWPLLWGRNCCSWEWLTALTDAYGGNGAAHQLPSCSPAQSDLLVVTGVVNEKMAPILIKTYEEMPSPKWVIALGVCACTAGPFQGISVTHGVGQYLPVDIYVPGCPPTPQAIIQGFRLLQEKIRKGGRSRVEVSKQ